MTVDVVAVLFSVNGDSDPKRWLRSYTPILNGGSDPGLGLGLGLRLGLRLALTLGSEPPFRPLTLLSTEL